MKMPKLYKKNYFDNVVIVTGSLNSGKSMVAPIVSSLNKVSHICITSVDVLKNFSDIYTSLGLKVKKEVFFIAGNKRIEEEIKKNFSDNRTITAENPSNEAMLDIILQHSD